ncbi:hypothetical protein GCM10009552_37750 [Rothia nasimurium]
MIQWKAVKPDSGAAKLADALAKLPILDAMSITALLLRAPVVLFNDEARSIIQHHVSARREESGGLLLGHAFIPCEGTTAIPYPLVVVSKAAPSHEYIGTTVSLQMGPSVWDMAREHTDSGLLVVGWFHSHPNLGAFFSGTDRKTQRDFFFHPYSLGYVVDPVRSEHAFFLGAESFQLFEESVFHVQAAIFSRVNAGPG